MVPLYNQQTPQMTSLSQKSVNLIEFTPESVTGDSDGLPLTPANTPAFHTSQTKTLNEKFLPTAQKQRALAQQAALKLVKAATTDTNMRSYSNENGPTATSFNPYSHVRVSPGHFLVLPAAEQPHTQPKTTSQTSVQLENLNMALKAAISGQQPATSSSSSSQQLAERSLSTPTSQMQSLSLGAPLLTPQSVSTNSARVQQLSTGGTGSTTKRLADLQNKHARLLSQVEKAQRDLAQAEDKQTKVANELQRYTDQAKTAESTINDLQAKMNALTEKEQRQRQVIDTLEASVQSLKQQAVQAEQQRDEYLTKGRHAAQEFELVSAKLTAAREELQRLEQRRVDEEKQMKEDVEAQLAAAQQKVREKVSEARKQLDDLVEKQHNAKLAANAADSTRAAAAEALTLLLKRRMEEEAEADYARQEATALLNGLKAEQNAAQELAAEAKAILEEQLAAAEGAQRDLETAEMRLQDVTAALNATERRLEEYSLKEQDLDASLKEKESRLAVLNLKCENAEEELEQDTMDLHDLRQVREEEERRLEEAKHQRSKAEAACTEAGEAVKTAALTIRQISEKAAADEAAKVVVENARIAEQDELIQKLEGDVVSAQEQIDNVKHAAAEDIAQIQIEAEQHISELYARLETAEQAKVDALTVAESLDIELADVRRSRDEINARLNQTEANLAAETESRWRVEADFLKLQDEMVLVRREVEEVKERAAQIADVRVKAAEAAVDEIKSMMEAQVKRAEQAEKKVEVIEEQMCQALEERDQAEDRNEALTAKTESLTAEINQLTATLKEHQQAAIISQEQIQKLQQESTQLEQDLKNMKLERDEAQQLVHTLQTHVDQSQKRIAKEVERAAKAEAAIETDFADGHKTIEKLERRVDLLSTRNGQLKSTAAALARALSTMLKLGGGGSEGSLSFEGVEEIMDQLAAVETLLAQ